VTKRKREWEVGGSKKCSQDVWRKFGGKEGSKKKILASPRYLMGVRTDQRSLSKLGERKTFAGGIIRISLTKPLLKPGLSSQARWPLEPPSCVRVYI
jgi:hypothetical protein